MKFSPKCRTKKLGMIYTFLGSFCLFLIWERADIRPQIRPRKIPVFSNKMLVIRAGIRKMLVRLSNREDTDHTASDETV